MRLKVSFLALFVFIFSFANGQSLDSLIRLGIRENLELKILEKEYLAALEKVPQVGQRPDPELGIGIFPLPVETRLGSQILRASAMQMLPWFGLLESQKDVENAQTKVVLEQAEVRVLSVKYEIRKAFYQLYDLQKSQQIIQQNLVLFSAMEKIALAQVESGKGSTADVLKIQLQREELELNLMIKEEKEIAFIVSINQLLNRDLETEIIIVDSLSFADLPLDKKSLSQNISNEHPMIKMYGLQQDISKKRIELNQLNTKPSFGVGLDYILINERQDAFPDNNGRDVVQIKGVMRIPINKKRYEAKEREENIKISILEDRKIDLVAQFSAQLEKAYSKHTISKLQFELYKRQKQTTEAIIRILESKYSSSGNGFEKLLLLQKDLVDLDLKILEAVVDSWLAVAEVDLVVGY